MGDLAIHPFRQALRHSPNAANLTAHGKDDKRLVV